MTSLGGVSPPAIPGEPQTKTDAAAAKLAQIADDFEGISVWSVMSLLG
jgi:hypothetical protein